MKPPYSLDQIMNIIDDATAPPMSKHDALELLERCSTDIEIRIEALRDEIREHE